MYFPPGEYRLERAIRVTASRVIFRGAGMAASRVTETAGAVELFSVRGDDVAFEDLGFQAEARSAPLQIAELCRSRGDDDAVRDWAQHQPPRPRQAPIKPSDPNEKDVGGRPRP